jgi:endonuclease/exonuclease/phosphatase family metal-dependent hydrolase
VLGVAADCRLGLVRLCTWNIQLGLRLDAVLETVKTQPDFTSLDLFALQEASIHNGREDAAAIAEALGPEYRHFQATAQMLRGRDQGNALIWRQGAFEPSAPEVVALTGAGLPLMTRAERALLRAVPPQRRIAIRAESAAVRVYVIHLDVIGFTHKLEQFKAVLSDMTARPSVPLTLVAGDLNTFGPPRLQMWRRIRAAARSAGLVEVTRSIRRTHWTAQKLDAVYVRARAGLAHRAWTLKVRASDHLPVFAEIDE